MKFIDMVCATFLALVKPDSTIANPACMNMTRKPVKRVHMKLMEILLWPTRSITSGRVGFLTSFTGTSFAVPVDAPLASFRAAGAADCARSNTPPAVAAVSANVAPIMNDRTNRLGNSMVALSLIWKSAPPREGVGTFTKQDQGHTDRLKNIHVRRDPLRRLACVSTFMSDA